MSLKPAHESLLEAIQRHCRNLEGIDEAIADGVTRTESGTLLPPGTFETGKTAEIGAVCSLLEVLKVTIIPQDKLADTIKGLAEIEYHHTAIYVAIRKLRARI
jgi:hypothetical protein